jgi:hypothetical protein
VKRTGTGNAFRRRTLCAAALAFAMAGSAHAAEPTAAGAVSLKQARAAWDRGSLDAAEPLYRDALEKGGLSPSEVLEGYVRLGSIRANHGKKDSALAAFRAASVLDANFTVPTEAGTKGTRIAEKAKHDTGKIGSIRLTVQAPREAPSGKPFKVTATVDHAHLRMLRKVTLFAKDGTTAKETLLEAAPDDSVEFEIGPDLTLPGAAIAIRVDALDGRDNRLASTEERVRVPDKDSGAVAAAPVATASSKPAAPRPESSAAASTTSGPPPPARDSGVHTGGSFWSSPWPYIIGGLALVGTGAAVYFGTRPSDNISLGSPGVRTQ